MVFRGRNCQGNWKLRADPALCLSDSKPKLKTNMVKPRKRRFYLIQRVRPQNEQCLAGLRTFLRLKNVKILLYIIVLILRGCFDRTHGLSKLFHYLLIFSKTTNCTRSTGSCNFVSLWKKFTHVIYSKLHSKSCDTKWNSTPISITQSSANANHCISKDNLKVESLPVSLKI